MGTRSARRALTYQTPHAAHTRICKMTLLAAVPPTRISNRIVRQRAACRCFSELLVDRQLLLLGMVLRSPQDSLLQAVSFILGTLQRATSRYVRRVGRPRKKWVPSPSIMHTSPKIMGSSWRLRGQRLIGNTWSEVGESDCFWSFIFT